MVDMTFLCYSTKVILKRHFSYKCVLRARASRIRRVCSPIFHHTARHLLMNLSLYKSESALFGSLRVLVCFKCNGCWQTGRMRVPILDAPKLFHVRSSLAMFGEAKTIGATCSFLRNSVKILNPKLHRM